jgi:hypothetical protein
VVSSAIFESVYHDAKAPITETASPSPRIPSRSPAPPTWCRPRMCRVPSTPRHLSRSWPASSRDIQDEADTRGGQRLRAWDSCGLRLFTLHASGHNPRSKQSQRWRQRIYHKFAYYPDRFKTLGCVGCG